MVDFGFWMNFRQEDRICRKGTGRGQEGDRKGGEEKAETGDWRGRGEQLVAETGE